MDFSKIDLTASVDDDLGQVPEPSGEYVILEEADYDGYLKDIKVVDKSLESIAREQNKYPDKQIDKCQYEWTFEITEPGFEGHTIRDWTSRNWRPPKSQAYKYARVLYGRELEAGEMVKKSKLVGVPCRITVTVFTKTDGTQRNYIDSIGSLKKPAPKAGFKLGPDAGYPRRFQEACITVMDGRGFNREQLKAELRKAFPGYVEFSKLHKDAQLPVLEWIEREAQRVPEPEEVLEF